MSYYSVCISTILSLAYNLSSSSWVLSLVSLIKSIVNSIQIIWIQANPAYTPAGVNDLNARWKLNFI